jgi:hypothetical protein
MPAAMSVPTLASDTDVRSRLGRLAKATAIGMTVLVILGFGMLAFSILGLFGLINTPVGPVRQHLSPADLASSSVAGATLMLAVFTAYLAIATRASVAATRGEAAIAEKALQAAQEQAQIGAKQVDATNRNAEIAKDTLEAGWRPMLVDVPTQWDPARSKVQIMSGDIIGGLSIELWLRNIGSGPAIITRAGVHAGSAGGPASAIMSSVVPVGEATRLEFQLAPEPPTNAVISTLKQSQPVRVTVFYSDPGGHHQWRTRVELAQAEGSEWRIRSLELSEENAEPFAKSGPMF